MTWNYMTKPRGSHKGGFTLDRKAEWCWPDAIKWQPLNTGTHGQQKTLNGKILKYRKANEKAFNRRMWLTVITALDEQINADSYNWLHIIGSLQVSLDDSCTHENKQNTKWCKSNRCIVSSAWVNSFLRRELHWSMPAEKIDFDFGKILSLVISVFRDFAPHRTSLNLPEKGCRASSNEERYASKSILSKAFQPNVVHCCQEQKKPRGSQKESISFVLPPD